MNPHNYLTGTAPAGGTQPGWPTGNNPNMYSIPLQHGANQSQYFQPQPPRFYPQQATGMMQGSPPMLARSHYQQQPLQQMNIHPMQQQANYQGQLYQQQRYQQSYQQGYQQQPLQQHQQFHQSHVPSFQQQSMLPPGQPLVQAPPVQAPPIQTLSVQAPTQIDSTVSRMQQEKMLRDAQKKKEFQEQKQKFRSVVMGASTVNPVDALFGKPSSTVKKQPVEETFKDEQEAEVKHMQLADGTLQDKKKVEEPQQLENVTESPSVDQLLSESLKSLDLKKEVSKVKRFQQSSFQTHKSQPTSHQKIFVSSNKARDWGAVDELSGFFSEADEFTQFEAAPIQQGMHNQATNQIPPDQSQAYPQHLVQSNQETCDDEFGTFQSIRAQPVTALTVASNQQIVQNAAQSNTQVFTAFPLVTTTVSSPLPSVTGQQITEPASPDDFGMFQSTVIPSLRPVSINQPAPFSANTQQGGNRDSFGDFQSDTNNPNISGMIERHTVHPSTIPVPSEFPYWQCSIDQLPELYQDVYNACIMADQFLDTQRLFPILSSSGLQRSLLRDIWSLVNQVQPGRLTKEEFCQTLGLIALAQSGISNPTLLELSKQTHPPVPQLALDVNNQHKQTSNSKEIGASSLINEDSDSKYDVLEVISEPSISTLTFSETVSSDTKLTTSVVTMPTTAPVSCQAVDDPNNKYDIFKTTLDPTSVGAGLHTNNMSDQFLTSTNQSVTSTKHSLILSSDPLMSSGEFLMSSSKVFASTSQPLKMANKPLAMSYSSDQSLTLTSQPSTSSSQPVTSTSHPLISSSQPITADQHLTLTNQPTKDLSFEFGEFQGSSTEQSVATSNWASFESAFSTNNATTHIGTTVSVNTHTSGSQFAVFDEINFPPTTTTFTSGNVVTNQSEDKYAVFNAVRTDDPIASTTGYEENEFGQFEMSQPLPNRQDAVEVKHYSTQMEILEKCLKACDSTLSTAADLLSEVKERRVLNELFSSTEGIEKAQGYFEMFKLAKRVASTAVQLDGEAFTNIKKQWKKIVLAFPSGLLTKLSNRGNSPSVKSRSPNHDQRCFICGFSSKVSIAGDALYHRDLLIQGDTAYHVVCANMWSHMMNEELPVCTQA